MNPRLFIGPMSKEIVDAVIDYPESLGLIPSRRQVDHESGYVNGWVTETFCEYVRSKTDNVLLVRLFFGGYTVLLQMRKWILLSIVLFNLEQH